MDANGFHTTYQLTPDGRAVQTITYGSAGSETATYNSNGQRTHTVSESGVEHTVVFNPNTGFVSSQSSGNVSYTYNYDGRYASQYGRPASIAPALGAPTIFSYNNELQEVQVARGDLISKMAYDELGRAIYRQQQVGDGKQWTSHYGYDAKGFVTNLVTEGIEVNGAESSLSYGYTSDDRSRLKSILFPSGALQTYDYDDRGNVTRMKLGSYTETYDHDLNNNLTGVRQGGDLVQVARYDGLDRATNVIHKTGAQDETSASSYYPGGEQQSLTVTDPQFGTLQQQTIDRIDELGRPLQVTVHGTALSPQYQYTYGPLSSSITGPRATATTAWDIAGNQISYTDPNLTTTMHRDDNGRVYQVDRREDGASYSQMFGYDDLDHQISLGDLLGTEFTYLPRADGSQLKVINARGNAATLEHTSMGELLRQRRADGMEVRHRHDQERQVIYEGDPGAGFNFGYDDQLRLTNSTLRSGATVTYGGFDPRNLPTTITIPGGAEIRQYDLQRQLLQRKLNYQSTTWEEDYTYDALGRPRVVTYIQNGGPANTATFDFDPAGPLTQVRYHEDNTDFTVGYAYYSDGFRRSVTYPSGVTVTDVRDVTGRLTGVSDGNGNIISATSWHGNSQPSVVQLGATMQIVNTYDARGRLVGSRVTRLSDGAVLAHARYQFDGVNNLEIRQFVHRGGKADVFGFDTGERVAQAQIGIVLTNVGGFGPALYQRHYDYDATGLDYLSTVTVNGPSSNAPPFATNWTAHDSFLLPGFVDGAARGAADPMGNVAQATLWVRPAGATSAQPVSATLQHDGHGRLIRITRADGLTIENQYQASGLRFSRKVFQGGQLIAYSAYVYDSAARLLEEYDRTAAQPLLIARYYYASGDAPVAADFRDSGSGQLRRYYFLRDNAMSVIALADKDGNVVERAWYDTFGQPQLERRDTSPPTVAKIAADTGGSLLIAMSEPVQAAWTDPGSGGGIVLLPNTITNAIQVTDSNSVPIPGDLTLPASVPGYKQFAALRFTPSQSMIGAVTVTLNAGKLSDEWANTNAALSVTLTNTGPAGAVYYSAPSHADTSPTLLARSDTGSPVLFHGQYFDYDAGLIYLRARFYDPYSGMFFEPDPLGYEDSVNHYAGLGNNPVSLRDPSGLMTSRFRRFLNSERAGYKPHEVAFIEQVHPHLSRLGMGDLEIAAHVRVMMRRLKNNGEHWEVAVRTFGKPGERRHRIEEGYPNKPEEVEVKSNEKAVATHDKDVEIDGQKHRQFTSDMDALYFKRNGEFASYDQYRHFQREVNNEVDRLRKPWQADLAAQGKSVKFDVRQDPYQHGASFSIPEQFGLLHKLSSAKGGASGYFGQEAWNHIADKMTKGPGEGFVISISKEGRFDTHNLSVDRVNQLGRAALDDFKARITEGSGRTDAGLQRRLNAQAIKDGASSATFYPWWLHTGVQ
jgi:RHS repeat-associated protein